MTHFAEIDSNGKVLRVIVAEQDFIDSEKVGEPSNWIQTSYNGNFRKQYAGIGMSYDSVKDKFIREKPYPSWVLDDNDDWQAPTPRPLNATRKTTWNEIKQEWE